MDVQVIDRQGIERHDVEELPLLLKREDALVWVDIPSCDPTSRDVLVEQFGFHWLAVRDCVERNHVSKFHVYADYLFVVLHAPKVGRRGHVHYVELDQFIGRNFLVTVHGPLNPAVDPAVALVDTAAVLQRIQDGRLVPQSPFDLSHAIVAAMIRREVDLIAELAQQSGRLEQRVMLDEERDDPESFIEELFQIWYELLAVRTMAVHSTATYTGMTKRARTLPETGAPLLADTADQFELVKTMADGQREFLHGVIECYQTRISTHTTIAAEKVASVSVRQNDDMRRISAWVAIVAVPTAVTGFFGQNVPYPGFGRSSGVVASIVLMLVMAVVLYVVFRRKTWL
ncbi:MAG TPA: magnesium transporter CorA family protein [Actinomycetales bacterium]|nr:magnesium transporter CorA family protein [Actinomycetales bacterium]